MGSVGDVLFFVQLLVFFGLFFIKLVNVLSAGRFYQYSESDKSYSGVFPFVLFIASFIFYAVGFVSFVSNPTILTSSLFKLETWFIPLNIIFLIVELMFVFNNGKLLSGGVREAAGRR